MGLAAERRRLEGLGLSLKVVYTTQGSRAASSQAWRSTVGFGAGFMCPDPSLCRQRT